MWLPKKDWDTPGHDNVGPVRMIFTEDTTELVADVYIIWTGNDGTGNWVFTEHWKHTKSTGSWDPVPGPLADTVKVVELDTGYLIASAERSVSGDWLLEIVPGGDSG